MKQRAGFVALIGAPNAGKSTLMNTLVGAKVSIVTPKVQTTRTRVRGIVMHKETQIIFIDTPGIFAPKRRLDRAMVNAAWQGANDGDLVVLLHDSARSKVDEETKSIINKLNKNKQRAALILNKVDLVAKERLLARAQELTSEFEFEHVFMISAKKGKGTADLLDWLGEELPEGNYYFNPDDLSDMPERLLAAEILREKLFLNLHQELPYHLTVETEQWEEKPDGSAELRCAIYVERAGHRGIILGKGGETLGRIGKAARLELEELLGRRVHLFTFVKLRKNWMDDPGRYRAWDLDFNV